MAYPRVRIGSLASASLLLALAPVLAGCNGSSDDSPTGPNGNGEGAAVTVGDFFFDPDAFSVEPGDEVLWVWDGSEIHNVTWVDANLPDSPNQASGTHEVTMPSTDGEYAYYCTFHGTPTSGMHGSIIVGSGGQDASDEEGQEDDADEEDDGNDEGDDQEDESDDEDDDDYGGA
jgi:plastocyanin